MKRFGEIYKESKTIHKASFITSLFLLLWILTGISASLIIAEPVWLYTGKGTTITHFFPFRVHYVTDLEGGDVVIKTDFFLELQKISLLTYIIGMGFVFSLIFFCTPKIPEFFDNEDVKDSTAGIISIFFFLLFFLSALEDSKAFVIATNFNDFSLYLNGEPWRWDDHVQYTGIKNNNVYQLYLAVSLAFLLLTISIFTVTLIGMILFSRTKLLTGSPARGLYERTLRNISLLLSILYGLIAILIFFSLIPFTQNADLMPGLPIFVVLILLFVLTFRDWKEPHEAKEDETKIYLWVLLFIFIQFVFIALSQFFAKNYLS